jgi:hypothetical protein
MVAVQKFIPRVFLLISTGSALIIPRSGTTSEDITYVLPIWEGSLASHGEAADLAVLEDMKSLLGVGGSQTKLGWSFSSWALSRDIMNATADFAFDPTNINYMLDLSLKANLPALVHSMFFSLPVVLSPVVLLTKIARDEVW